MFSVAICDDEKVICKQIELYLETHIMDNRISTEIFYSGEQLYEAIEKGKQFDLIFLDIELTMLSGIAVGMKIREELCNEATHLVFISGKSEYAMDLFPLRPLHFLVKPFSREQVIGTLEKAMSLSVIYNQYFEFQIDHILHRINYQNILFFESNARKVVLHTNSEEYKFYGKLNDVEEQTRHHFLRIHQSYLVNPLYVERYAYNKVVLIDSRELPISETNRKAIKGRLIKNWKEL